jgi:NitT/TauT family transport system permease protein
VDSSAAPAGQPAVPLSTAAAASSPHATGRRRSRRAAAVAAALGPWAAVWFVWEMAARHGWVNLALFPPPSSFVGYLIEEKFSIGLGRDATSIHWSIVASFLRVLAGLALGFAAALVAGVLIAMSRLASLVTLPIVRGLAPIAPIAWIPLGIVLFGLGNPTAIFIVFVGVFFVLTIATVSAVTSVDPRLIKTARTLGASPRHIWLRVIFPAVVPQVFTMLRLNFFGAWMGVLAAEMVGLRNGLGAIIIMGREMFNANLILVGMALIGASGYAVDGLLLVIQRRVLWWQPGADSR